MTSIESRCSGQRPPRSPRRPDGHAVRQPCPGGHRRKVGLPCDVPCGRSRGGRPEPCAHRDRRSSREATCRAPDPSIHAQRTIDRRIASSVAVCASSDRSSRSPRTTSSSSPGDLFLDWTDDERTGSSRWADHPFRRREVASFGPSTGTGRACRRVLSRRPTNPADDVRERLGHHWPRAARRLTGQQASGGRRYGRWRTSSSPC
jgi:hypothetical protein